MRPLKRLCRRSDRDGSVTSAGNSQAPEGTHENPVASRDAASIEHPQGLEVVHEDPNASLDIIAVHGLNGHREKT
ncbi:hypothetical protein GGR58DRAFT_507509 [Xylaria digitata]|nr:hypothetical protein GGR58DRAFT_507509 [Xylaria digitata]